MKGLAITSRGLEDTASAEIMELTGRKCEISDGCVAFEFKKPEELCLLCYKAQSVDRVIHLIGSFEFGDFLKELEEFLDKTSLDEWMESHKVFRVECTRLGTHDFKSTDAETKAAKIILKKYGKNAKFSLREHEIMFFIYIAGSRCYFGVDFAGFELNKRGYKIFLHPSSLRGTIAYALLRESGFGKKDVLLDPFSRDGIVAIEAAFYSLDFPHNYFKKDRFAFTKLKLGIDCEKFFKSADKKIKKTGPKIYAFDHLFKYVDYCKKNAKIAGVDKSINFSRVDLEWLDIKFKKESVDRIATSLPSSKNANLEKIYKEFFYQADYILKKDGRIALIARIPDLAIKHAGSNNFEVIKQKEVWSGEQAMKIVLLKKKSI